MDTVDMTALTNSMPIDIATAIEMVRLLSAVIIGVIGFILLWRILSTIIRPLAGSRRRLDEVAGKEVTAILSQIVALLVVASVLAETIDPILIEWLPRAIVVWAANIPLAIIVIAVFRKLHELNHVLLTSGAIFDDDSGVAQPLRAVVDVVIFVAGGMIVLQTLGMDITALLAASGVGALAIAIAAQERVANALGFFSLLIDRPFTIGDTIVIYPDPSKPADVGARGVVYAISLQDTRLTHPKGSIIVPNRTFSTAITMKLAGEDCRRGSSRCQSQSPARRLTGSAPASARCCWWRSASFLMTACTYVVVEATGGFRPPHRTILHHSGA